MADSIRGLNLAEAFVEAALGQLALDAVDNGDGAFDRNDTCMRGKLAARPVQDAIYFVTRQNLFLDKRFQQGGEDCSDSEADSRGTELMHDKSPD